MGHKNFTISELGDRGGAQKTITPSSLRYEDQIEVSLPLATLWVVLRNQLLIAGRPHLNVDVGWSAAVQRRSAFQHFSKNGKADLLKC